MTFTLSDQQCSIAVTISVNDKPAPVYGYRARVKRAARDTTGKRRNVLYPAICSHAKTQEAAIGSLFKKIHRMF